MSVSEAGHAGVSESRNFIASPSFSASQVSFQSAVQQQHFAIASRHITRDGQHLGEYVQLHQIPRPARYTRAPLQRGVYLIPLGLPALAFAMKLTDLPLVGALFNDVPGSYLAKLTPLWKLYHVLRGSYGVAVRRLHARYGIDPVPSTC